MRREGKYKEFIIKQGRGESNYKFFRRVIVDVVLQINSGITVYQLAEELRKITGKNITIYFLLSTLVFANSGIIIDGDMVWASKYDRKVAQKISKIAKSIIREEREILREEFFSRIREEIESNLPDMVLSSAIFNKRTRIKWRVRIRKGQPVVFLND